MSNPVSSTTVSTEEQKTPGRMKDMLIYPLSEVAGGTYEAYFATYLSLLMTTVYKFSVTLSGVLESLQAIVIWVTQPFFGLLIDRYTFRKSKYVPWFIIFGVGCGLAYILVFTIPLFTSEPTKLAVPVACLIIIASICAAGGDQVGLNIYAVVAKVEKDRAFIASCAKFGRDSMKVILGFSFPLMLAAFTNIFGQAVKAWALTALILAGVAIIAYIFVAVWVAGSQVEKEQFAAKSANKAKKKVDLKLTVMSIITNRALLVAFVATVLSKMFFFFHIMGGAFFWKFYMGNFTMMAAFSTAFSLSAIIGALCMPTFVKLVKDTKRTYVIAFLIQFAIYLVAMLLISPSAPIQTIAVLSCASFFNGVTDSLIMSLFAGATDYAKWKYGTCELGLTMACYSLGIRIGLVCSIAARTAVLAAGGFDSKALAAGAAVPAGVMSALFNMNTLYPAILCIIITIVVMLLYPVNDKRLIEMRAEVKAREAMAE